jgi:hypothetical protein
LLGFRANYRGSSQDLKKWQYVDIHQAKTLKLQTILFAAL